jgi:hypothetical protein
VRRFWPPAEAAQAEYEALRAAALAGTPPVGAAATRMARGGLAALIARPGVRPPAFSAVVVGAARPAWSPHADARLERLAEVFALLTADQCPNEQEEVAR